MSVPVAVPPTTANGIAKFTSERLPLAIIVMMRLSLGERFAALSGISYSLELNDTITAKCSINI